MSALTDPLDPAAYAWGDTPIYFSTLVDQAREDVKRIAEVVTTRRQPVIVCPTCHATSGHECRTSSGRKARWHAGRRSA